MCLVIDSIEIVWKDELVFGVVCLMKDGREGNRFCCLDRSSLGQVTQADHSICGVKGRGVVGKRSNQPNWVRLR